MFSTPLNNSLDEYIEAIKLIEEIELISNALNRYQDFELLSMRLKLVNPIDDLNDFTLPPRDSNVIFKAGLKAIKEDRERRLKELEVDLNAKR